MPVKKVEKDIVRPPDDFHYYTFFENSADIIGVVDPPGNFREINRQFEIESGYRREDFLGQNLFTCGLLTDDSLNKITSAIQEVYEGAEIVKFEVEGIISDGTVVPYELRGVPIKKDGEIIELYATLRNLSERKRAEEALRKSEEKYRTLFDNAADLIAVIDREGIFIELNNQFEIESGYTKEEMIGKNAFTCGILSESSVEKAVYNLTEALEGRDWEVFEVDGVRKDGNLVPFELCAVPIWENDEIVAVQAILRNIAMRREVEAERMKTDKLESLGILAGGIAHDFNNILTAVLTNISYSKLSLNPEDDIYDTLRDAETACIKARDLTQQLITFSKGGMPVKKPVSIRDIIRDYTEFSLRGTDIEYEINTPKGLWSANADENQIIQVINNLLINSLQSIAGKGKIVVRASNVYISPEDGLLLKEGNYVKVSFMDNGRGIPPENLTRIFDPYFTTKEGGSGLGLASVYSIINNHEGHIRVKSEINQGTTFTIFIPAIKKIITGKTEKETESVKPGNVQGARILIMDDNELILKSVPKMLENIGYEIETARNGKEAIEKYKRALNNGKDFDAVLLDFTVKGGMGGKETLEKMKKIDPRVRAIVTSGYSKDRVMSDYKKYGFQMAIHKPYKITDLSNILSQTIAKPFKNKKHEKKTMQPGSALKNEKILIVDDDPAICSSLKRFFSLKKYDVNTARSGEDALASLKDDVPDLLIMDVHLPGMSGLDTLKQIKKKFAKLPVIIMTAYGTTEIAIEATKSGAFNYILKPFDPEAILDTVKMALEAGKIMQSTIEMNGSPDSTSSDVIIGHSDVMQEVYKAIGRAAPTDATVLIRGESGTGKELVARAIYQHSLRAESPFLIINCVAIPDTLLESELFGYEKGAFTGADNRRIGKIEQADGGTIFLDEIGDMPHNIQPKIMRLLQEKSIERLGGHKSIPVDVRIIAATNRNLEKAIEEGRFREDLFYRLNVVNINIPPLRARKEDIPSLCDYFLGRFANELEIENPGLMQKAMKKLIEYEWSGNVRQLANSLQNALIFNKNLQPLASEDIVPGIRHEYLFTKIAGDGHVGIEEMVKKWAMEKMTDSLPEDRFINVLNQLADIASKSVIEKTLEFFKGNKKQAAGYLGISRQTLYEKIARYEITDRA